MNLTAELPLSCYCQHTAYGVALLCRTSHGAITAISITLFSSTIFYHRLLLNSFLSKAKNPPGLRPDLEPPALHHKHPKGRTKSKVLTKEIRQKDEREKWWPPQGKARKWLQGAFWTPWKAWKKGSGSHQSSPDHVWGKEGGSASAAVLVDGERTLQPATSPPEMQIEPRGWGGWAVARGRPTRAGPPSPPRGDRSMPRLQSEWDGAPRGGIRALWGATRPSIPCSWVTAGGTTRDGGVVSVNIEREKGWPRIQSLAQLFLE